VNEIYNVGASAEELAKINESPSEESHQIKENVKRQMKEIKQKIAVIENPRDDSLDNCVVVWCSQAFALNANANVTPGENSVPRYVAVRCSPCIIQT
jgi:hypothetical protein